MSPLGAPVGAAPTGGLRLVADSQSEEGKKNGLANVCSSLPRQGQGAVPNAITYHALQPGARAPGPGLGPQAGPRAPGLGKLEHTLAKPFFGQKSV